MGVKPLKLMPDIITKLAYQTFQQSKSYFSLAHTSLSNQLRQLINPPQEVKTQGLGAELLESISMRMDALLERDWADAEAGVYPKELLFDNAWDDFFRYYPLMWVDIPSMWERMNNRQYHIFSPEIDTANYPRYYLQNFHHQTDGYLSDASANLYDLQVEILFGGTADAMRRRVIAPLRSALDATQVNRVLDVACGTGRMLKMLHDSLPNTALCGVDLSPAYLRKANTLLSQSKGNLPQLFQANAEVLPFADSYFEAVVSVFLFHELPAHVRQNVINECYRVMKPGGVLVFCDSIQVSDSPEFRVSMENFSVVLHEPYYRHYITDDLNTRLMDAGFVEVENQVHFCSKYWIARKPEPNS